MARRQQNQQQQQQTHHEVQGTIGVTYSNLEMVDMGQQIIIEVSKGISYFSIIETFLYYK